MIRKVGYFYDCVSWILEMEQYNKDVYTICEIFEDAEKRIGNARKNLKEQYEIYRRDIRSTRDHLARRRFINVKKELDTFGGEKSKKLNFKMFERLAHERSILVTPEHYQAARALVKRSREPYQPLACLHEAIRELCIDSEENMMEFRDKMGLSEEDMPIKSHGRREFCLKIPLGKHLSDLDPELSEMIGLVMDEKWELVSAYFKNIANGDEDLTTS